MPRCRAKSIEGAIVKGVNRTPTPATRHYSLQMENLPKAPPEKGQQALFGEEEA
jgi:hypothetical protein